jgi:hypothetical protein
MRLIGVFLGLGAGISAWAADSAKVTFHKDVLPVLQKNCQGCHRPGETAPMAFLSYSQTRPWARAIREAVLLKRMPPWFADPAYGNFHNDRTLAKGEIATLVRWADTGAAEGNPKDAPRPLQFADGWVMGKPDLEFEMPAAFEVPASGTIEYQYVVVPTNFTGDRWVQKVEARPGNRALVHHIVVFVRPPGSKWLRDAKPGVPFVPPAGSRDRDGGGEFLIGFAPGSMPEVLEPGRAKLIPAGADIVFQLHYTANGKPGTDRSKIGLIFAKEPPRERVLTVAVANNKFAIPPGAASHLVEATLEFASPVILTGMLPHMHLRGKDFELRAVYPSGEKQVLLRVPKYSFSWQLSYYPETPVPLPKGTRIEATAHFDNSPNNPHNPDPTKEVRWGDQSWEEMMIGFMDVAFDAKMDPKELFARGQRPEGE